jgi:hypothetical protein
MMTQAMMRSSVFVLLLVRHIACLATLALAVNADAHESI